MKIIPQSHEWITPLNRDVTMQRIERIARTCYQSAVSYTHLTLPTNSRV